MKHSATPSLPQPQQQPVSILRRSSTGGAASSKYKNSSTSTTSFNRSPHKIDTEYDASDRTPRNNNSNNNSSFHGDVNNSHLSLNSSAPNLNSNRNFTPITGPNELADRFLRFQRSYARSSNNVATATAYQSPISVRRHRSPPRATPPLPLRPTSSGRPRSQLMSPSAKDPPKHNQQHRHNSEKSWSDAAEEEYVRRMARIKLDKSDRSIRGSASSTEYCSDGFQSGEMHASSPSRSFSSSSSKNHQSLDRSSASSCADDASSSLQSCDKNGRCKLHPQYKLYNKKLRGGYELISNCPMCFALSLNDPKSSGGNQDHHSDTASSKSSSASASAKMSHRNSTTRSRERGRSKSANRTPIVPIELDEGNDYATSKADPGLLRSGRVKSVEQLHHLGLGESEERQRRSRTRSPHNRSKDMQGNRSSNISSRGKNLTRALALGNMRDKLTTHMPSSVNLPQETSSQRHRSRSRSRGARRISDKEQRLDDGASLNGLRALDKDKRRSSRDKASASYAGAGRSNQKSDLGSNLFVHESSKVNFDKKTGRCKKHPSVIIAKKSTFRPGTWEVVKKNGCPLCAEAEAKVGSDRDEVVQEIDKDTKRKMDLLLKGGQDISEDTSSHLWTSRSHDHEGDWSHGSQVEVHQPVTAVTSNPPCQDLFVGQSQRNWQQYLTKGKRNTSRQRGSIRSNLPERDTSRGRRASSTGRSASRERRLGAGRKLFGRAPEKIDCNDREVNNVVNNMPFTDNFGDSGIYTGQVNDDGRPNGKGSMKYDNGIFYEGAWTDGSQDEKAVIQYDRIRGGFTSWEGKGKVVVKSGKTMPWNAHKKDEHDKNDTTNVRGMEWVDLNGDEGRYTGEVNNDKVPHGKGIMKYDFGLIAKGEWFYGVLKENPHDRVLSAVDLSARGQGGDAVSVMSSARSLGIGGGMSVGTGMSGGMSVGTGMSGGMSVGP
eukprot:scaffold7039_cov153-Skeletonema_dohrnii-CCMP3373.AAC.2